MWSRWSSSQACNDKWIEHHQFISKLATSNVSPINLKHYIFDCKIRNANSHFLTFHRVSRLTWCRQSNESCWGFPKCCGTLQCYFEDGITVSITKVWKDIALYAIKMFLHCWPWVRTIFVWGKLIMNVCVADGFSCVPRNVNYILFTNTASPLRGGGVNYHNSVWLKACYHSFKF